MTQALPPSWSSVISWLKCSLFCTLSQISTTWVLKAAATCQKGGVLVIQLQTLGVGKGTARSSLKLWSPGARYSTTIMQSNPALTGKCLGGGSKWWYLVALVVTGECYAALWDNIWCQRILAAICLFQWVSVAWRTCFHLTEVCHCSDLLCAW